ncbi:MAG: hypothetical protein H6550_05980 [Chitinophagales bacterium]|nr:hypothetical protein [Chitinophagales bacterium]
MNRESEPYSYLNLTEEIYTRAFAQAVADQVFVVDRNGVFLDVKMNNHDQDNYLPAEAYNGKTIYDIGLEPKLSDTFKACILRTIVNKKLQIHRYTVQVEDKSKHNEARFFYLDSEKVLIINRNITPLVQVTDKLFTNQGILRSIIDNYEDSIFSVNKKQEYIIFNEAHKQAMKKKYGVDIETGHSMAEYINISEDLGIAQELFEKALMGQSSTIEHLFGDDSLFRGMTQIHIFPMKNYEDKILGVTVFSKDRSPHHKAQLEKDKYIITLETLLSDVSHKLRRPVASMLGLLQLVDEVKTTDEMNKLLSFFRESVGEMDDFIIEMSRSLQENRNTYQ